MIHNIRRCRVLAKEWYSATLYNRLARVSEKKSDQIDGWSVQLITRKGKKENTCGKKSSCHNWELNPYLLLAKQTFCLRSKPFACEASALTTEPS